MHDVRREIPGNFDSQVARLDSHSRVDSAVAEDGPFVSAAWQWDEDRTSRRSRAGVADDERLVDLMARLPVGKSAGDRPPDMETRSSPAR